MVVFTSGIVDECPIRSCPGRQYYLSSSPCGVGVGVERGLVVRGGVGTLLGPEASGFWFLPLPARRWVPWSCSGFSPVWVWGGGVWGLVGLLFEICIVDASIN